MAAHKNTIELIVFALTESPGPIEQKNLPKITGVDDRNVRRVLRELAEKGIVRIKVRKYSEGNLVYLHSGTKKDLRKFWKWVYLEAKKGEILPVSVSGTPLSGTIASTP